MQFMKDLKKIIKELQKNIVNALAKAQTESELEQVRLDYLTRQGALAQLMARLKAMTPEEKESLGRCSITYANKHLNSLKYARKS